MKLILLSNPTLIPNEINLIVQLFKNGLDDFQIYKPNFSKEEVQNYIQQIPAEHHKHISLHIDFPKFHSLQELEAHTEKYEYAFLSPIFDSISKDGYKSKFALQDLTGKIINKNIIALGGIDENQIEICRKLGFMGVAVLGAIWKSPNPVKKYKNLKALCQKKDLVF